MLTERFDEGILLLRRLMGWHMIDVAYVPVNESKRSKSSWVARDGTEVRGRRPHFDDLPREVRLTTLRVDSPVRTER